MFRIIISSEVSPWHFFVLCDDRHCGEYLSVPVPPDAVPDDAQGGFLVHLIKGGWGISLDAQLCPAHAPKPEARKLIELASNIPGVIDGRRS